MYRFRAPSPRSRAPRSCAPLFILVSMACTSGGGAQPPTQPKAPASAESAAPAAPSPVAGAPTPGIFTDLPAVDLSPLGSAERAALLRMANEEICPCGCPQSLAGCLQANTRCEPAVKLASWAVDQLAQGLPAEAIAEMLAGESVGFSARPKEIALEGFAAKGPAAATYTLVEFADFECGHCKMTAPVLARLVEKYPGRVRVVFKHFPLSFHPMAKRAAEATEAAGRQGRFWEMHDAVFATQNMLSEELILGHAKAIGLDVARFQQDWNDPATAAKVEGSRSEGEALGVQATPAVYVNGRPFGLMRTLDALELRLAMEDARASSSCQ